MPTHLRVILVKLADHKV